MPRKRFIWKLWKRKKVSRAWPLSCPWMHNYVLGLYFLLGLGQISLPSAPLFFATLPMKKK